MLPWPQRTTLVPTMTQAAPLCLVTRPEPEATRFARAIEARFGIETLVAPVLEICVREASIEIDRFAGVILTSVNGARSLERLRVSKETPCFAVGEKTAGIAESLGYSAVSLGGDAASLVAELKALNPVVPLIHLRGEHSRGDVSASLTSAGLECQEIVVYQQVEVCWGEKVRARLEGARLVILPVLSPRTAKLVSARVGNSSKIWPVAMSPAVAMDLTLLGAAPAVVSASPTEAALIEAIATLPPMRAWVEKAGGQS